MSRTLALLTMMAALALLPACLSRTPAAKIYALPATDTATAQQNQKLARSRLTGIRSTWSSFGGNSSKLGS